VREEIQRISKLVAEGKLSPEDAADLIDAFYASERNESVEEPAAAATGSGNSNQPPPPPGGPRAVPDPLKQIVESIERLTKEGAEAVNWKEVSQQARTSARKGFEALKGGIEDISKGKVNLGWLSTQETRDVTLPLSVPPGKTLKIENPCGDVKVLGGFDVGSATAHARFRGGSHEDAKQKADAYTLILEESDHAVVIKQPDVSGLQVDLEVQVGAGINVEVRAESGDVQVYDTKGGCRVTGRSGDVKLRGLTGVVEISAESGDINVSESELTSLHAENKSGDITLTKVRGNVTARSATGNLRLSESSGKVVSIESVSGDVHAILGEPVTGNLNVRTVNGNATVAVPDGSDCRVSLSTLRGTVECGLVLQDEARQDQRITGRLGAGTGTLDVSAVTGDITVEMRDHAKL